MNALTKFYSAVQSSFIAIEGPVKLAANRDGPDAGRELLENVLSRRDLDRLHTAAAEHAATHPLKDELLPLLRDVHDLYLDRWRFSAATGGVEPPDDWEAVENNSAALRDALDALAAHRDVGAKDTPPRKYVTAEQAQLIAEKNYESLWRVDNKSDWARQIGCHRTAVGKLKAWHDAKRRRQNWRKLETRLKNVVDPKIIEALHTSDASVLGSLAVSDRDKLDAMPDADRAELIELLTEQARDAIS